MAENKTMVYPAHGMCVFCGHQSDTDEPDTYAVHIEKGTGIMCKGCMEQAVHSIALALHKMVSLNDTVWELVLCDDDEWRIFPMVVKSVAPYGSVRWVKDKEPTVWNIYAENEERYTKMYKNFYDAGKTLFFTEEEAKAALERKRARTASCME